MSGSHETRGLQSPVNLNSGPPPAVELTFDARRILRWVFLVCVLAEAAFVVLDYHVNFASWTDIAPIRRMFNITREDGLASWFGVTQTALAALTLWLIFITVRGRSASGWTRFGWLVMALFFSYMAVDDGATIHERMGSTLDALRERAARGGADASGVAGLANRFPSYAWQIMFVPVFGALGVFTLLFLWRELTDRSSRLLVGLALACMALAVGLDFVEGLEPGHRWNLYTLIADHVDLKEFTQWRFNATPFETLRHFSKSIEETLEMFAMTVMWLVFLRHWMRIASDLRIRFVNAGT